MVDKIWYNMEELIGGSEERGINRNILECKVWKIYKRIFCWSCINRNIFECKVRCGCASGNRGTGINRNILECKGVWDA